MVTLRPSHTQPVALGELATQLGLPAPGSAVAVAGVTLDSRSVRSGDLYAALPGANVHGASFAAGAAAAGAVAILTDPTGAEVITGAGVDLPVLVVPDPRAVLGGLAARVYASPPAGLALVGITGTNGKTTTAYLLDSALRALGQQVGLVGTVETRVGPTRVKSERTTPESTEVHALLAAMHEAGCATGVMEVSSHALTLHRVDGVVYDVAVFTNLSQDHLDHHGSMERYFQAKASLFTPERARHGIVCVDDQWGRRLAADAPIPVTTLAGGAEADADWRIIADPDDPAAFALTGTDATLDLRSALPGDFNRVNTALAALVLLQLGHDVDDVVAAVRTDPHVPGRMERVTPTGGGTAPLAVVDYAHTPEAVAAALAALRGHTAGSIVVVLGAGGDRDTTKRAAMGAAAAHGAALVIVTDDNPRSEEPAAIRAAVLAGARSADATAQISEIPDRREAISAAVAEAIRRGPGSAVAVVGKGHESGQDIAGVVHPFDDRVELQTALDAWCGGGA